MAKRAKPHRSTGNHLSSEKSPYLLQHADNPVEWYPWGEEAFEAARREDKPIFLSIGYSTCHWCHVMAHESFEDPMVAQMMNDAFVNIKVDREERPDIDGIYMTVCQMMTGGGGWPLTIVMTPDKQPFFAGTYFPKDGRFGRAGMTELVPAIVKMWRDKRTEVLESAAKVTSALVAPLEGTKGSEMDDRFLNTAALQLNQRFDEEHGGFGPAPKFPSPHNLTFLLRFWKREADEWSLFMVKRTLEAMRRGGLFDQVGYGFHRYSTDERWLLPHFEKMLYDQAGLLIAYTEAYLASGDVAFGRVVEEVAEYLFRDMTSPEGAFYSAEDADSEGVEGKFYVWSLVEMEEVLGAEDAELAARVFDSTKAGNFDEEATGRSTGNNVLHLPRPLANVATSLDMEEEDLATRVEDIRVRLLAARGERVRPHLDDKVLTDWNGFMIAAMARAGTALDRPDLVDAAGKAAKFVMENLRQEDGRLLHRYREGDAAINGHLDDHAYMIWGLLELYEATFDITHLEHAIAINGIMLEHFWDHEGGGFFRTPDDGEELLMRQKEVYDGAMPSGNSVAMLDLLRLSHLTGDPAHAQRASELGMAFSGEVSSIPMGFSQLMSALDMALGSAREVVIVGKPGDEDTKAMLDAIHHAFLPNTVVLLKDPDAGPEGVERLAPFVKDHGMKNGMATAYVCTDHFCRNPTNDVDEMMKELVG
jgi:uncharacterized protein YyaL (SSP411 family)